MKLFLVLFGFPIALIVIFAVKVVYLESRGRWSVRRGFPVIGVAEFDSADAVNKNERGSATRPAATERRDDNG